MPVRTDHYQAFADANFTATRTIAVTNETRGSTLIATLQVLSFTGGSANKISTRLFFVSTEGVRTPSTKVNASAGELLAAGTHVLSWGPAGDQQGSQDKNFGALPRNFEIDIVPNGDQTSADVKFDIVIA